MLFNIATTETEQGSLRKALFCSLYEGLFDFKFYDGVITKPGHEGLYMTAKSIIKANINEEYVIFAEDDLKLTKRFSINRFKELIDLAKDLDVLVTGSWHGWGYKGELPLLHLDRFRGTQLIVIYKKAYERILEYPVYNHLEDTISFKGFDIRITFPFLSKQRTDLPSMLLRENHNHLFDEEENIIRQITRLNKHTKRN